MRQLRSSQLETQLAQAQLEVLKMQLQPHFLFNTLHSISTLMHRDVESADRMISRLSEFLRLTLNSAGEQEVDDDDLEERIVQWPLRMPKRARGPKR